MKPTHSLLLLSSTLWPLGSAHAVDPSDAQKPIVAPIPIPIPNPNSNTAPSYRDDLLALHKSLIKIPSVTNGGREGKVADFLEVYLTSLGWTVYLQNVVPPKPTTTPQPRRWNVLAWPPTNDTSYPSATFTYRHFIHGYTSPRVLVSSHIDVVPPFIPYSIDDSTSIGPDTVIRGRGSVDAKASVAAQITAVLDLLASGEARPEDVMLLFVVGEETNGDGMKYFSNELQTRGVGGAKFEAAVFGEPTENRLACGHKGISGGYVRAEGRAAHSGYPWLGKSATEVLMRGLVRVMDADLGSSERYGNTTVNVGRIMGGVAANVVAKEAIAQIAIRIGGGDQATGAVAVREKVEGILKETDEEAFSVEWSYGYGPVECNCDVDGFETFVANYGTDVPNLKGDHVSYLYGPGSILVAHGDNEALRVRDLEESVEGFKRIIKHALST